MFAQRNELINQLPNYGWAVIHIEDHLREWTSDEWFIDELWMIESIWSPQGLRAFVTFVVDPQTDLIARKKGKGVWAVKASLRRPTSWGIEDHEIGLVLSKGWYKQLHPFLKNLNALRLHKQHTLA